MWEESGVAISDDMGFSWPGPSMEMEGSDWWYFIIPTEYHPLERNIAMRFDGGNQDIILNGPVTHSWWYNGSWHPENPDGPQPPVISASPAGGYFIEQTIEVTLSVSGEELEASRYTIDGSNPANGIPFEDGTTITIGAGMAFDTSMTLKLMASNPYGIREQEYTFTRVEEIPTPDFTWDNGTIYFVMTDRFYDGNPSNNNSYGRPQVDARGSNIGTFHGGDVAGLKKKLDEGYFSNLGVNAIWITAPYEQAHGFVGGGDNGDFAHYGYHGYYALDWTMMDRNMGTVEEMRAFVNEAHRQGIRVILDVVMNHPGYGTLVDMAKYGYGGANMSVQDAVNWAPPQGGNWFSYHDILDYSNASSWTGYWGSDWVRAGLPGYQEGGGDELTQNLEHLPDIKTETTHSVGLPPLLQTKWSMEQSGHGDWIVPAAAGLRQDLGIAPADYLVKWLAAWVEEFGIDGFRVDTAKHVRPVRPASPKERLRRPDIAEVAPPGAGLQAGKYPGRDAGAWPGAARRRVPVRGPGRPRGPR